MKATNLKAKRKKLILSVASAIALVSSATVNAEKAQSLSIDIKSKSADLALMELAKSAGVQIMMSSSSSDSIILPPITGQYTLSQALDQILDGSGLAYRFTSDTTLVVSEEGDEESQGSDEAEKRADEEIIVTGSALLKDPGQVTKNVTIYDRKVIEASGATTLDEFMRTIPQNINAATEVGSGFVGNFGGARNVFGASGVNLRGLGEEATLILIDGKRTANGGVLGDAVDISSIPISQIERIDVLLDGASSIYGSDAVGGVVNIIMRKDYEGGVVNLEYQTPQDGGTEQFRFTAAKTFAWDSGNLSVNYSHLQRTPLNGEERPELQFSSGGPLNETLATMPIVSPSNLTASGRIFDPSTFEVTLVPLFYVDSDGNHHASRVFVDDLLAPGFGGFDNVTPQPDWTPVFNAQFPDSGLLSLANVREGFQDGPAPTFARSLIPERNDHSIRFDLKQDLTDDIRLSVSTAYSTSESNSSVTQQEIALSSSATVPIDPSEGPWSPAMPNPSNPFGTEFSFAAVLPGVPNQTRESERESMSFSVGIDGTFENDWQWDVGVSYSEADNNALTLNQFDNNALFFAEFDDEYTEYDPVTQELIRIPFVGTYDFASPEPFFGSDFESFMQDFIYNPQPTRSRNKQKGFEATLQGRIFSLAAGDVNSLIRFGRREEEQLTRDLVFAPTSRAALVDRDLFGGGGSELVSQGVEVTNFLAAEALVPLVGSANELPLVQSLALSMSGRLDDVNYFDDNSTSIGLGLVWEMNDTFRIRYNYSDAFQVPGFNAYTQEDRLVRNVDFRFRGRLYEDDGTLQPFSGPRYAPTFRRGGNTNLEAEELTSNTLSLDITPESLPGFKTTISYHRERETNQLGRFPNVALRFSDVALSETDPAAFEAKYPGVTVGDYSTFLCDDGTFDCYPSFRSPATTIANFIIDTRLQNVGDTRSDGVDLRMSYFVDTGIGDFDFILDYSRNLSFERRVFNGCGEDCGLAPDSGESINGSSTEFFDLVDTSPVGTPFGAIPEHRATLRSTWSYSGFEVSLNASFQSAITKITRVSEEPNFSGVPSVNVDTVDQRRTTKVDPRVDLVAWYDFNHMDSTPGWLENTRVRLSMPDILEAKTTITVDPVLPLDAFAPLIPQFVNPYGRTFTLSIERQF